MGDIFAKQPSASLSTVAAAADVGRSTLHRYFPDRASLLDALLDDGVAATARAFEEAAVDQGTPIEALRRLVQAQFEVAPKMNFLFAEVPDDVWASRQDFEAAHWPIGALLERGCRDGVFDPEISGEWIVRVLWYLMAAGSEAVAEGVMARHEAIANISRILEGGIRMPSERG